MNNLECDEEFYIPYNSQDVLVNVLCERDEMYFKVHLPTGEVKLLHDVDEEGKDYWILDPPGDEDLAEALGELIEYAPMMGLMPA